MYAGLHGLAQGLGQVLEAASAISDSEQVTFTLVGDGPERSSLIQKKEDLKLVNVRFSDPVPKNNVPGILQKADALLVPLKIQLTGAVPSKLYEAMALGKPVLLIAAGEAAQIVRGSQCGIVVEPGDVDGLAAAILYLKNNPAECSQMGKNGREAAVRNHDRKQIADRFAMSLLSEA